MTLSFASSQLFFLRTNHHRHRQEGYIPHLQQTAFESCNDTVAPESLPSCPLQTAFAMATGGVQEAFTADNVLTAMLTMRGSAADKKKVAMDYLAKFQKSVSTFIPLPLPIRYRVQHHCSHCIAEKRTDLNPIDRKMLGLLPSPFCSPPATPKPMPCCSLRPH